MSYALQLDLSKGNICIDHPRGIFLLWVNLPPLMLAGLRKPVMLFLCDFPLYDQQAELLCFLHHVLAFLQLGQWHVVDEYDGQVRELNCKSICHSPMCHQQRWARIVPAWKAEMQRAGDPPWAVASRGGGVAARPAGAGAASCRCRAEARWGWRGDAARWCWRGQLSVPSRGPLGVARPAGVARR
jgi:hypothetical protein